MVKRLLSRTAAMGVVLLALVLVLSNPMAMAEEAVHPAAVASKQWLDEHIPGFPVEVLNGAVAEGQLMVYHLVFRDNARGVVEAFTNRFPFIRVEQYVASGGPLAERFMSESRAGRGIADVWMNSSPAFANQVAQEGLLAYWLPPNDHEVPEPWKNSGYWYGIGLAHIGVAWNTLEVSPDEQALLESVRTWDDIFKPEFASFRNRAGMVSVRAGGTTQLPYYAFEQLYGQDVYRTLKASFEPVIFSAIGPLADRLVAGEFAVVPHATADTAMATRWLLGAPLQWSFPEPGLAVPYLMGISSIAPHPNAARLFMAWSLTPEGQAAWVNATGLAPTRPGIDDQRPWTKEAWYRLPSEYYAVDWSEIEASVPAMIERFEAVFGR